MTTGLQRLDVKASNHEIQLERLIGRVRAEYLEMPGLRLSIAQAQRLWSLDVKTCASVLEALLADRFLTCTSKGSYRRFDSV